MAECPTPSTPSRRVPGEPGSSDKSALGELQDALAAAIRAAQKTVPYPKEGIMVRLYRRWRAPVTPQRRLLRTGLITTAAFFGCQALCLYLFLAVLRAFPQALPPIVIGYLGAELIFAGAWKRKYDRFNKIPVPHAPRDPNFDPRHVYEEFVHNQKRLCRYISIEDMMRTWFCNAPLSEIKRGNIADLVLYGFFYKSREEVEAEGQGHMLEVLVSELEDAWSIKFEEGYNPNVHFMAHLWQPIRCTYRPLAFYIGIEMIFLLKHLLMVNLGFRAMKYEGFTYYVHGNLPIMEGSESSRAPSSDLEPSQVPILFLHGVGMGLFPYIIFIARLTLTGQPVIAFECDHLGMRWVPHIPDADEVVRNIVGMLKKHGVTRTCVSGHSYGTFHASRLLKMWPEVVQSLCLMDPVNFNMFTGKLIHNFVYFPDKTSGRTTFIVARDIHHAASVCRNFYWSMINLWPQQLPQHSLVVLSGNDELVPVPETVTMLHYDAPQTEIVFRPGHRHAEFIKDIELQKQVAYEIHEMMKRAEAHRHSSADVACRVKVMQQELAEKEEMEAEAEDDFDPNHPKQGLRNRKDQSASKQHKSLLSRTNSGKVVLPDEMLKEEMKLPEDPVRAAAISDTVSGTVVRPLGYKGVLALQRMGLDFKDDSRALRKSMSAEAQAAQQQVPAPGGKHKRMRSRGSFDFAAEQQKREEQERQEAEREAKLSAAFQKGSGGGAYQVSADARGDS